MGDLMLYVDGLDSDTLSSVDYSITGHRSTGRGSHQELTLSFEVYIRAHAFDKTVADMDQYPKFRLVDDKWQIKGTLAIVELQWGHKDTTTRYSAIGIKWCMKPRGDDDE